MLVSIVIVNYNVKEQLFACLSSLYSVKSKTTFEIIIVDNDETPIIEKDLKKKFPEVVYKKTSRNLGYGGGNNYGAQFAKGEYLFFVNPDTFFLPKTSVIPSVVEESLSPQFVARDPSTLVGMTTTKFISDTLDVLVAFLQKEKHAALVAPILLDKNKKPYPLQGTETLTPIRAIVCLSFINKLFPNNPIAKTYWHMEWDKKEIITTDVVPGTAFLVRKSIFKEVGGFDEKFFLFFEENDLCLRIKKLGYKMYINPNAKLVHLWGESTKSLKNTKEIFQKSRRYYFTKHFGFFWAMVVDLFC